jgi:hypothetical protein
MPLFYLHVCNGIGFVEDEDGSDYLDANAAREAASAGLRDIMASELRDGSINLSSFIEIEDENHTLVTTVAFTDAVKVSGEARPRP